MKRKLSLGGFTLIELLIVIGIIAILATVAVLVLNPAELLKQGRDSNRIAELKSLDKALSFAIAQNPDITTGAANTIYISLPDLDGDTDCLDDYPALPALTSPWVYKCAVPTNLRKTDGTGWLPINFQSLSPSPLDTLPIDPKNTLVGGFYYSYVTGYEFNSKLESVKYSSGGARDVESNDGGDNNLILEAGVNLKLAQNASQTFVSVETGCRDTELVFYPLAPASGLEFYSKWTIPGSGSIQVTKLWYWQSANGGLGAGESLELAIYSGTSPNFSKIGTVTINGTSTAGAVWLSGSLASSVNVTLGNTYVFGVGPLSGNYFLPADLNSDCSVGAGYPPGGGVYKEFAGGGLDNSIVFSESDTAHAGIFGISY